MEKREIYEFIKEYGSDPEINRMRKSGVIKFVLDNKGNVSGRYRGGIVFRHRDHENDIMSGETWMCNLEQSWSNDSVYYAKPVQKIDASFLFELKKDQMDEIAEHIWDKHKELIEPEMKEKYLEITEAQIAGAVEVTRTEYESKIKEMSGKVQELELKDKENRIIINSLQNKIAVSEQAERLPVRQTSELKQTAGVSILPDVSIRRTGPDTISSEFFGRSRYFIHLSADYRTMIIVPHDSGDVVCFDNEITLSGLNMISPFSEAYDMFSEYSPTYGGVQIYLK